MRMSILLPSLFAASLLTTAALADRNSDDNDKAPLRASKDRVVREARSQEAKEARARVQTKDATPAAKSGSQKTTAAAKLADKRGCSTDDGSSCSRSSARSEKAAKTATTKAATQVKMPSFLQQKGCATEDGSSCSSSTKAAAAKGTTASGDGRYMVGSKARNASVSETILKLRREVDEKAFLDMMNIMTCKRSGSCGETPDGM